MKQFMTHSVNIFSNIDRTESYGQDSFNMCLNFSSFVLLYSRIGAGAGTA
jgi:hypothetical protein